jgi:hypothetical protein
MIISYLLFGDDQTNYYQAYWSALSFMRQMEDEDKLVFITDRPEYFGWIEDRAEKIVLNERIIKEWKGKFNFFWRIKIKALQKIAETFPGEDMLYLDADTFLKGNLKLVRQMLKKAATVMHTNEGKLNKFKAKTTKHMWRRMKNKEYGGLVVNKQSCMWNAGVVGLPSKKHCRLDLALQICDEMCRDVDRKRLLEQFALSLALDSEQDLLAADQQIHHYWSDKDQWNEQIKEFILDTHLKGYNFEEQMEAVERILNSQL